MNENNATAEFRVEGEPAFPATENKETENSSVSPTGEQTSTEQTQSQEGEQATADTTKKADSEDERLFNHPRWQERETDWKKRFNDQETRHQEDLKGLREEFEQKYGNKKPAEQSNNSGLPDTPPSWFGGDEQAWKEFKQWNEQQSSQVKEAARKEVLDEMKSKTDAEQKAIKDATDYMNSEVTTIETDKSLNPNGIKVDKNKLFKIVHDMQLVDTQGRWNYRAGFEIYKSQLAGSGKGKTDTTDRKAIAAATTSDKRSEPVAPNVTTSDDFKKPGARPW